MQNFGDFCFFSIHGGVGLDYVSYKVNELAIFSTEGKMSFQDFNPIIS
jgi:hypothetical protein